MFHYCLYIAFLITTLSFRIQVANSECPIVETDYLHRLGDTRYYVLHKLKRENCQHNNGDCLAFADAEQECMKNGDMFLGQIETMQTLAVIGRLLEKMVKANDWKDTWYWLNAYYDFDGTDAWNNFRPTALEPQIFTNILYRPPRPIGVGGFMNWKGEYDLESEVKQCLALALPWPGKGDPHGKGAIYGHQTMFDERPCESRQKRHALCMTYNPECFSKVDDPFVLTERQTDYFNEGNWIFGDRRYVVNWDHLRKIKAIEYCEDLGLTLFEPEGGEEELLIHYLKMWTREVTVSQFWTAYIWNSKEQTYLNRKNHTVAEHHHEPSNLPDDGSILSKKTKEYCVVFSLSYEFKGQLNCEDQTSPNCTWNFAEYIPANCNNKHAVICQHKNKNSRKGMWNPSYVLDVDKALKETAVTREFLYKGNTKLLRSKYKQTFGSLYCPDGYRMLRAKNVHLIDEGFQDGSEYSYDYINKYWVVDDELFDKHKDSNCTISEAWNIGRDQRELRKENCTKWHFYLCEQFQKKTIPAPPGFTFPTPAKMIWKEGPQRRIYPLINKPDGAPAGAGKLAGRMDMEKPKKHESKPKVRLQTGGMFGNWILKSINKSQRGFTILGRENESDEMSPKPPDFSG